MGALSFFTTIFSSSESQVKINPRRCLRTRLRGNRCNLCLQSCPTSALSFLDGSLHLDEETCSSCMSCTAVCPVDALTPKRDIRHIVEQAAGLTHPTLLFSCERHRLFREDEVLLPCVGIFSHELLLFMASILPHKAIGFNVRECSGCRNEKISRRFQQSLASLLQHGSDSTTAALELITKEPGDKEPTDRRSFFKAMRRGAVNAAFSYRASPGQEVQQRATSRTVPAKTALLNKALQLADPPHPLAARMIPRLAIGENCRPCSRCAGICPTGALKMIRRGQKKKLEFDPASCCGCALCVDFCKEGSLSLSCNL